MRKMAPWFVLASLCVLVLVTRASALSVEDGEKLRQAVLTGDWEQAPRVFFGMAVDDVQRTLGNPDVSDTFEGLVSHTYGDVRVVYASGRVVLLGFPTASPALLSASFPTQHPRWREYANESSQKCVAASVASWSGGSVAVLYWYAQGMELFGSRQAVGAHDLLNKSSQ